MVTPATQVGNPNLKPTQLTPKFNQVVTTKRLSTKAAKAKIADDNWDGSDCLQHNIYDALMQHLDPPQPGEYLAYDFDEHKIFTITHICHPNSLKLEEIPQSKVLI